MLANSRKIVKEVSNTTQLDEALSLIVKRCVKWTIRSFSMQQARGLADEAFKIDNQADTHQLMNHALKTADLSVLVREIRPSKTQ